MNIDFPGYGCLKMGRKRRWRCLDKLPTTSKESSWEKGQEGRGEGRQGISRVLIDRRWERRRRGIC
jgi:hypothetical protein